MFPDCWISVIPLLMINWLHNSHAAFVVAAYSIALLTLGGFAVVSWFWARAQDKKIQKLQKERQELVS